jgi:hypothetical protein
MIIDSNNRHFVFDEYQRAIRIDGISRSSIVFRERDELALFKACENFLSTITHRHKKIRISSHASKIDGHGKQYFECEIGYIFV